MPFGSIAGVKVGQLFEGRKALHDAGVHAGLMRGIAPGGASIVISGGYADDEDNGDEIVYTGEGGRDPESGRQIADQVFTGGNAALARNSVEGNPVRVNRLVSGKTYRYDGLYRVEEYWSEKGKDGYLIWRYRLVGIQGQEPAKPTLEIPKGNATPSKTESTISRIIRNTEVGNTVKKIHAHTCQVCCTELKTPAGPYAECCHIKPLGKPHCGPDVIQNVLCLCPNCHVLFDNHAILLDDDLQVLGTTKKLKLSKDHPIDIDFIRYHRRLANGL